MQLKYRALCQRLSSIYEEGEARAIVRWVLEERFSLTRAELLCDDLQHLSMEQQQELEALMQRLEQGEPVQYVLGETRFYGRRFHVAPGVLIPRPETAELCQWVIDESADESVLLDVGTGSGCIAVTLSLELPHTNVTAWDISEDALRIAQKNAQLNDASVTFEQRDILIQGDKESRRQGDKEARRQGGKETRRQGVQGVWGVWDVIVSNPPYICRQEAKDMERHVLDYEPHLALFVPDDDPLLFYRAIASYGCQTFRPGGKLYFEINPLYSDALTAMLQTMGYEDIQLRLDQSGKRRFLRGSYGGKL